MSNGTTPPTPESTPNPTGEEISAAMTTVAAFLGTMPEGIAQVLSLAIGVAAKVEPAVYDVIAGAIQGTDLTPEASAAMTRLQNPDQYFS